MEDIMSLTPLGAGQEVGRSCHVLEFRGMTIMLDIGIHPGYDGMNGLPFLDRIEPDQIDVLLVTHFHLDHAASLPYLTERTNFKGRIFMTHPTKSVLRLLLGDYLRLLQMNNAKAEDVLYTEAELQSCINKIELIDYHTTVTVGGLSFHALNAGHVLGACMFWMELGGRSVLYTGDYSMEQDRHLMAAEIPDQKPDLLIVESTYGVQAHTSRPEREARFTGTVERVVTRGGRCLIPVFALGRAQELLLILDEYWQANPHLQKIPIYYASKLASRALRVYQTYANMMNARIRAQMDISNPFSFRFIQNLKSIDVHNFDDSGPSVVFASPGMLQSGVSRQLFDRWAADPKNGVLIAGYAVEHTLAKEIMAQPKEVVSLEGRRQPLNCLVDYVSFSAHVDFVQNRSFITQVAPRHIILVHGQKDEMGRLKSALVHMYKQYPENKRPTITMPPNLQEVKLKFARRRSAKVMGTLANREDEPQEGEKVEGIMVTNSFSSKIVSPDDLATYTPLRLGSISSKLHVPFCGAATTLELFLNEMYHGVKKYETEGIEGSITNFELQGGKVSVTIGQSAGVAIVEWEASPAGDVIADSVVALLLHAQSSSASIRLTSKPCRHPRENNSDEPNEKKVKSEEISSEENLIESRLRLFHSILKEQYSNVEATLEGTKATYEIQGDGEDILCIVKVDFVDEMNAQVSVESEDEELGLRVQDCLRNTATAAAPIRV
ncbi:cleavage and polyadenylation specificity factor subunit 3 [Fistulifera solaris]|uniref:Cleavage and polyadenylation specificity factor subunit 3 n=1 Tax=Fistulifera solaris TaxID=1519565 RepID=A0A1Z5JMM1_FISSO|nr:cleavage and polyadenylation specificity factor subunit 3 [Fistulifera solaris]|eukprot:GAX15257.1 cleavage and polyadenylation specificity factor subunit 3 [Fistulifera solaris]